jgi:hypothetical protein
MAIMAYLVYQACRTKTLFLALLVIVSGCMSRYKTTYGEYRPEKPRFTLYPNRSIKQLDSERFNIKLAFDTILRTVPGPYYRDVLLFSNDYRFAAIGETQASQVKSNLILEVDPWLTAYQVGFYTLQNDTLKVEYFTNFQGGQYHTFKGVVSDSGKTLRVFEYYQGLGRHKVEINKPHRSKLGQISQVLVKY